MVSTGWPSDGRYLVTQKRDGDYVLLMWRDRPVWDPVARKPITVAPVGITLQFGQDFDMGVYRPSQSPAPLASTTGSSLSIQLGADVTALTLAPAQVAAITAPAPVETAPVLEPAPAPTDVTATPGDHTVTLGWSLPTTTADVTGFEIVRQPGGVVSTVAASARSFKDTGLANGTAYTFTVRALSPDGSSAPVSSPTVVPGSVPDAPYIAKTTARNGSVTVTWRKPAANGRPILGYQLVSGTKSVSFGPDVLQGTISGLKGQVQVGVRARNELGWGPYSYTPTVRARRR
jgi:hypothetical protein